MLFRALKKYWLMSEKEARFRAYLFDSTVPFAVRDAPKSFIRRMRMRPFSRKERIKWTIARETRLTQEEGLRNSSLFDRLGPETTLLGPERFGEQVALCTSQTITGRWSFWKTRDEMAQMRELLCYLHSSSPIWVYCATWIIYVHYQLSMIAIAIANGCNNLNEAPAEESQ